MQFKYKLCVFLWYRLKLKLPKEIESQILERLISSFTLNHSPRFEVAKKYLVYNEKNYNSSFFELTRIVLHIMSVRALTRTLIFSTNSMPNSKEVFSISRWQLATKLIKNRQFLFHNMLSHISYIYLTVENFTAMEVLTPIHVGNEIFLENLFQCELFVIQPNYFGALQFKFNSEDIKRRTFADKFIDWNPKFFLEFLELHNLELESVADQYLLDNYPLLFSEKNRYLKIEYTNHEFSSFSVDSIFQKKGLEYFETVQNVEIWHQRFVYSKKKIVVFDATCSPTQKFVAGYWPFTYRNRKNSGVQIVLRPSEKFFELNEAIFLLGRCDENWYHFLLDTAPRLLFFENIPTTVPILVRSDLPSTTKNFLRKITARKILEVAPNETFRVSRLYVCPGRSTVFDSRPPKEMQQVDFSPLVLKLFRQKILDSFGNISDSSIPERIVFHRRSSTRNIVNWLSFEKVLGEFSFHNVELNAHFFSRQLEVFSNAKIVATPGGAVLANIIFMKPGSKIFVFQSWWNSRLNLWGELSKSFSLEYIEVVGLPTYWGLKFLRRVHSSFYISSRKLRRILSKEI